jgi:hypothetical protein
MLLSRHQNVGQHDNISFENVAKFKYKHCLLEGLLNYFSTLMREPIRSSETSGATQRTTRSHIPEDDTLHNHRCENLKSYMFGTTFCLYLERMVPI